MTLEENKSEVWIFTYTGSEFDYFIEIGYPNPIIVDHTFFYGTEERNFIDRIFAAKVWMAI